MNATELVRILDTWSDALNVAELVSSPWLRIGNGWDLSDWQTVEWADGVTFQRLNARGDVIEVVTVVGEGDAPRHVHGPFGAVPTWTVCLDDPHPAVSHV